MHEAEREGGVGGGEREVEQETGCDVVWMGVLTTVMSSLSNHCSLSSARGHMSGRRAVFIRFTQRRERSSPGEP